jgi:phenylacetate-CoA ligase
MRDYLLQSYRQIFGSYGASDLEINIAAETDFTIALRRELLKNEPLRKALTRTEWGVLPMIFQYNPFDYVIETNPEGELLLSISRAENLSPRIRYNIHDRGHVLRMKQLRQALAHHGAKHVLSSLRLDFPLLFYYGRSDLTVSYYGAKVTPESIREILYDHPDLIKRVNSFRLISYEDRALQKHLLFALEMKQGEKELPEHETKELEKEIIETLRERNLDFASAYRMSTKETAPELRSFALGEGPFVGSGTKLKNEYVATLEYDQAHAAGLL